MTRATVRGIGVGLMALVLAGVAYLSATTPSAADLDHRIDGIVTANLVQRLAPDQVPPVLAGALVAIEDEHFYSHHGLDSIGLARALLTDAVGRCACEGGSTITQQLADMVYYPGSPPLSRKLASMVVALRIEAQHSKPEILADYLSITPTGRGLVGAQAASCAYFGHPIGQLTLGQAAEIAGMPQAPSAYDPRFAPNLARQRRNEVLGRMVADHYVTAGQAAAAEAEPVLAERTGCAG
ncbi:MAG TPA: biosynthetic peptidoglycan transglycosylase [Candidatus Dormibacteraeota bacterium]